MGVVGERDEASGIVIKRLALAILLFATSVMAAELPPGRWWRQPAIVQMLALTDDQQSRLEGIFRGAANDLIDLKGEVEKSNIALRGELDRPQLDRAAIRRVGVRLNEARSRLFERELMMLVDMRSVLNDTQWNRLRNELDRLNRPQQQQQKPRGR
jgi:Spy/CpxP family protein refolding chaperone